MRVSASPRLRWFLIHEEFDENAVFDLSQFCKIGCCDKETETAHPGVEGADVAQS